ncbi:GAF domain-containing protein [Chroococcidiopsis thermalis]|uniref:Methyl-accepting chemotaxis sensory transducer n=1 Tax=Chroococcidiopsis thermalis (strain PCC 7203) TaxID=251229 RepID=K9U3V5_CHRTP|nr:GAF domain-containing protein [Chroococcidiopsis thermalis]AFY88924.1 methyl-accepting chemotaxis sensory transducer [Chroococcidiopsis thermalis PCC 7203]
MPKTQDPFPQSKNGKANSSNTLGTESHQGDLKKSNTVRPIQQMRSWNLKLKATIAAVVASALPALVVGTTNYLGTQAIHKQVTQAREQNVTELTTTENALQRQLQSQVLETGLIAAWAAAIAFFLVHRAIRPVLDATAVSTKLVNRLSQEDLDARDRVAGQDELVALESNISAIEQQLPKLLWQQEAEAERARILMKIAHQIGESLSEADVLRTTVEEVRKAFKVDRVAIFRCHNDSLWDGTFVEESVASSYPKMLWATIDTNFFQGENIELYRHGRVQAIDNIYQADLPDARIGLLERFAIASQLSAPIIKDNRLYGLLIANQCKQSRSWQHSEIDLIAHVATQVGFALKHADLLEQIDTKAKQAKLSIDITRRIRASLNEEDMLKTTVEEVRKAMKTDRVIVYGFDFNWYGTVIAESVVPGFPKAMWAQIQDPCFAEDYVDKYQQGRINAIEDIYAANLSECYLQQLEPFAVKANLVAPILKDDRLFGLLIAHECAKTRHWQQWEIDLFTQLAAQVGFALDHARLLQRIDAEGSRSQLLAQVTRRIRASLNEEDILKTTVEEARKAIKTDRVLVYGFDADWYGTVIAESVLPGFPKAMWAQIQDPCFAHGYVEKYQQGRVNAIDDIYAADLSECYLQQLEPFAVRANLVAPILKDDRLFGLLIAHECAKPRHWQQWEIDLFTQLATQVGFALDHARLLNQIDRAYQTATATSQEERQQKEGLQRQISELLRSSQTSVKTLSQEAIAQMDSVTLAYDRVQAVAQVTEKIVATVQQTERQVEQAKPTVETGDRVVSQAVDTIVAAQSAIIDVTQKLDRLDRATQKLPRMMETIAQVMYQLQLQTMNIKFAVSRTSNGRGEEFTSMSEKILSSLQQLETEFSQIKLLVANIQAETKEAAIAIDGSEAIFNPQLRAETQQKLDRIVAFSLQMIAFFEQVSQVAANQSEVSTSAERAIVEAASIATKTSAQAMAMAESLTKLAAVTQERSQ